MGVTLLLFSWYICKYEYYNSYENNLNSRNLYENSINIRIQMKIFLVIGIHMKIILVAGISIIESILKIISVGRNFIWK